MENMTRPDVHLNASHNCEEHVWDKTHRSMSIMSVVIFIVVCVLGVLGNGVVIWVTGFRMKKTVSSVWYLNLAVADFLVMAFLPLYITYYALDYHWPFGWFTCKTVRLVFYVNMYASIYLLVVISVDRCVGVVCPVWTRCSGHRTVRNASRISLGVWVLVLAPSIPNVIFRWSDEGCWDFADLHLVISKFFMGFVLPFSVIVTCYSIIVHRLRNRSLHHASQSGRSFRIIAAVIAAFFLCWIPFHVVQLLLVCCDTLKANMVLFGLPITFTLALVNSCVNPLLYVFSQGFKVAFRSRWSVLKVLEKAFDEEPPPQTSV